MKNKFIYLSMAMISTFSLASCNSFERKVDADTGKEIVAKANVASQEHIDNVTKQDFFSLDFVGELKGKANLDLSYKKTTEEATQNSLKSNIEYDFSFEYKGNHNAKNIKCDFDITKISVYFIRNHLNQCFCRIHNSVCLDCE